MKRRYVIATLVVLAIAVGTGFALMRRPPAESPTPTVVVGEGLVRPAVSASGPFYPADRREVSFSVAGTVESVAVHEGDVVGKGDTLATLDARDLRDAYEQALENLRSTRLRRDQAVARDDAEIRRAASALRAAERARALAEEGYRAARAAYDAAATSPTMTAQLDQLAASLRAAESQLAAARAQEEQARIAHELARTNARLDRAQMDAQVRLAEQALAQARRSLDDATLEAPIAGVVVSVNVEEGDTVSGRASSSAAVAASSALGAQQSSAAAAAGPHFVIAPADWKPEMEFTVDQSDVGKVQEGFRATATLDAHPDVTLRGRVVSVSRYPETASDVVSYRVRVVFDARPKALLPGMTGTVSIAGRASRGLVVPNAAIRYVNGRPTVRVATASGFRTRAVRVGLSDSENTIVLSGLSRGERVAIAFVTPSQRQSARPRTMFGGGR